MAATQILAADIKDSDITDADIAAANKDGSAGTACMRTLGTGSTQAAAGNHVHAASDITSGTIATARLGSGTANSSKFLRGDQAYASVSRSICLVLFSSSQTVAVGDGTIGFCVPAMMNGLLLTAVTASVVTAGTTSGTTDIQIRRVRGAANADMLSTKVTLSVSEFTASDGVVDAANDDLATGDLLFADVDAVNAVAPIGLSVTMTFE